MDRIRTTGLTEHDASKSFEGYTLFSPNGGTTTYLVDMDGNTVHEWHTKLTPGNWGYLLDNGNLLFAGNIGKAPAPLPGSGGLIMELDWDSNVVWQYEDPNQHHDFSRAPNGNTMVLGWETVPEALVAKVQGGEPGTELDGNIWTDYIHEVTPSGEVVWEWHAHEALDVDVDILCPLHHRHEWTHANTCTALPDGNVLTSFRHLNTIGIIDRQTGGWVWKLRDIRLGHQHDPSLLDNGNVLVFANGYHDFEGQPGSKIFEIDPRTNEFVWEYKTTPGWEFFSHFISSAQRLPNGNTLICEGSTGRIFEVTMEHEIVWEYVNPYFIDHPRLGHINACFRARRYAPDHPALAERDLTPIA
jgi:hypothetical protein